MIVGQNTSKYFSATGALENFLKDVRTYDLLTPEKEEELLNNFRNGDETAWESLVCGNLRFIYSIAKNYYARNENDVLDYVNEGVIGLRSALEKFDITKGFKFITYAVWYIRRSMNYYLNTTNNIVNRSNSSKYGKKIDKIKGKIYLMQGREPNDDEIIRLMKENYNIDIKDVSDVYNLSIVSIDEEIDDDYTVEENSEFTDATACYNDYEATVENDYRRAKVKEILSLIPNEWQRDIIKMLNGIDYDREYSLEEVGEKYNIRVADVANLRAKLYVYIRQNYSKVAL